MSNSSESAEEGLWEASALLPHFDAWGPIDTMSRCFSYSLLEHDTTSVTPLDQPAAEREVPPGEDEASARPAGEPISLDLRHMDPGSIPQWLIEELVLRIEARLFPRLRQLLDVELEAWMRGKTFSTPPIEP